MLNPQVISQSIIMGCGVHSIKFMGSILPESCNFVYAKYINVE
jgi:hypothetical protein